LSSFCGQGGAAGAGDTIAAGGTADAVDYASAVARLPPGRARATGSAAAGPQFPRRPDATPAAASWGAAGRGSRRLARTPPRGTRPNGCRSCCAACPLRRVRCAAGNCWRGAGHLTRSATR
jgi:hypothetical protein